MRNILDRLYVSSIWLAAIMMIGVLVMVLTSIISRLLHFHVPGTDAYAGYAMAGAGFLALAHTLKCNEHIRVTLIISKLHSAPRRVMELWSLSVAVLLSGLLTFYAWRLVIQSHEFHDISTANDATPLWIPQILMGIGVSVLFVAFIDEWFLEWTGKRSHTATDTRHE